MNDNVPYIIGVAGESGVGKSTITDIISIFFGYHNTTIISTDDLHKWERNNSIWNNITHLNPDANNLELGDFHIEDLSKGKPIYRSIYNHKTGTFNPPTKIMPNKIVIVEGLHAFYSAICKNKINLKIFIDTDEELRKHWKIIRDTEERGYKYNTVLETINKRVNDSNKIRGAQIEAADVIIKINTVQKINLLGDKHQKLDLEISMIFKKEIDNKDLFSFIKNYNDLRSAFIKISRDLGEDITLCQNGGGNTSIKLPDHNMLIKSSGFDLKHIGEPGAHTAVNYKNMLCSQISNDTDLESLISGANILPKNKRPSMEMGFHILLKKCVIHLHPIYLTLLLSIKDSRQIIDALFKELDYEYIRYCNPGFDLYQEINNQNKNIDIFFLENHGIIISTDEPEAASEIIHKITDTAKNYITHELSLPAFDLSYADLQDVEKDRYIFPDAVVFMSDKNKKEIRAAHSYMNMVGKSLGEMRYLHPDDVLYLKGMQSEKHRKSV